MQNHKEAHNSSRLASARPKIGTSGEDVLNSNSIEACHSEGNLRSAESLLNSGRDGLGRREFLKFASAGVITGTLQAALPAVNSSAEIKNGIPYRELGRTGEKVSLVGIGGYHLGKQVDPNESISIIRKALDEGINFLDNCWDYNGGESEIRMGKARSATAIAKRLS